LTGSRRIDGIGSSFGNVLRGNAAANHLMGLDGNDEVFGGRGFDLLEGGDGNDFLSGGFGDDTISAGAGNDLIDGGPGPDHVSGDAGRDTFRFARIADVNVGAADEIIDFDPAEDVIDLRGIDANALVEGNQAFVFVQQWGTTPGQALLAVDESAGVTFFFGDVDGDGSDDVLLLIDRELRSPAGFLP
jgi:Ca2+-binding RTX toxin-like protein